LNCVTVPGATPKLCQFRALWLVPAPFWVVMTVVLPCVARLAAPWIAYRPLDWASASDGSVKAAATDNASVRGGWPQAAGLVATGVRERLAPRALGGGSDMAGTTT
jgi:hypothetical protein